MRVVFVHTGGDEKLTIYFLWPKRGNSGHFEFPSLYLRQEEADLFPTWCEDSPTTYLLMAEKSKTPKSLLWRPSS